MPWTDILSPAIVIAVVVLLWRDTNGRIATLAATVGNIDRRLATLEGRITGWQDHRTTPSPPTFNPDRSRDAPAFLPEQAQDTTAGEITCRRTTGTV